MVGGGGWVGQAITDPISGPSFVFTFTIGPELDKICLELGIMDWVNHSFLRNFRFMF